MTILVSIILFLNQYSENNGQEMESDLLYRSTEYEIGGGIIIIDTDEL